MAPDAASGPGSCWVVTDGKAGDLAQCEGVARALGVSFETKTVSPRRPYSWFLPHGPVDPHESPDYPGSVLAPPFPDIAIASGRRAVAYLPRIKATSGGKTFTVCLKDPRTGPEIADFIWVPSHDPLRGPNVMVTPTSPHRFSADVFETMRDTATPEIDNLPAPRVAVLVGGNSRHHRFSKTDIAAFMTGLELIASEDHGSCMISVSRRTPAALSKRLEAFSRTGSHLFYGGAGENPIASYLAKADAIVTTADSTNMIGEALATGRPVHVYHPEGGHPKIDRFLGMLSKQGSIHPFPGPLKTTRYEPIDATPLIAADILDRYAAYRADWANDSGK